MLETQAPLGEGTATNIAGARNAGSNAQANPFLMNAAPAGASAVSPATQFPSNMPMVSPAQMGNLSIYPELYYKLQPYILVACDQIDALGTVMPTQEMAEEMTDKICEEAVKMHPEMAEYMNNAQSSAGDDPPDPPDPPFGPRSGMFGFGPGFRFGPRFRFRRRGLFPDLIEILLLQELFRRRRFF